MSEQRQKQFFLCTCDAHAIEVTQEDDPPRWIYFSMWQQGIPNRSWRSRLSMAWHALCNDIFADNACLDRMTANALGKQLIALAEIPEIVSVTTYPESPRGGHYEVVGAI